MLAAEMSGAATPNLSKANTFPQGTGPASLSEGIGALAKIAAMAHRHDRTP